MDLSIIIVSFNTKELLAQTIKSVIDAVRNINYEIIVVDNASSDGSSEMIKKEYKNVRLIQNEANKGFANANNKGINLSTGKYILLLNSDTVVLKDCIEKCVKYLDINDDIGGLGCKVLLKDGELDHACKRGFPTPEASFYYMLKLDKLFPNKRHFGKYTLNYISEDDINDVDSLTGAFMMVKKEVIDKIGLLDEDFFMYGEDIDWCYKIKEAGWRVVYYPEASIVHYKGASSKKKRFKTIYEFHRAMYLFYNKHYLKKYNIFITALVYIGIGLKLLVSLIINLLKKGDKK